MADTFITVVQLTKGRETMRRLLTALMGLTLVGALVGCHHTAGTCDCGCDGGACGGGAEGMSALPALPGPDNVVA